jgi:hypothetical protein
MLVIGSATCPPHSAQCPIIVSHPHERNLSLGGSRVLDFSRMLVLDWLLDSDPAIRWQALRDLVHAPAEVVAAERARVLSWYDQSAA